MRMAVWTSLALVACSGPTTAPPSPPPSPSPSPPPLPTPRVSAPAPSSAARNAQDDLFAVPHVAPPPRPPPKPAGIDAETFDVLAGVCALASFRHADGVLRIGCRSGPPFEAADARPNGTIYEAGHFSEVCFVDAFYPGSFSASGRDEAIVGLAACGEDRLNDITPGNVFLAEREETGWGVTAVHPDTNIARCTPSQRPDRTLLMCRDGMGAFGSGALKWRFTLDFAAPQGSRERVFSKLYMSAPYSCDHGLDMVGERGAAVVDELDEKVADRDGDGDDDLVVTVARASAEGTPALVQKAKSLCQAQPGDPTLDLDKLVGPKRRHRLLFEGTPKGLEPNAPTKKLLEQWGAEAPEFWWNLKR
jgi:hypothetical protein